MIASKVTGLNETAREAGAQGARSASPRIPTSCSPRYEQCTRAGNHSTSNTPVGGRVVLQTRHHRVVTPEVSQERS